MRLEMVVMRSHRTLLPKGVGLGLESLVCSVFILGWHWCNASDCPLNM